MSAALVQACNDIIYLDCVEAIHKNTPLPNVLATMVAEYRGGFIEPELEKVWQQPLPNDYHYGYFAQPLSGNRVAAVSGNGNVTVFNALTGKILTNFKRNKSNSTWVQHVQALPDDRLIMALNNATFDVVNVENSRLQSCKIDYPIKGLTCVKSAEETKLVVASITEIVTYSVDLDEQKKVSWPQKKRFNYRDVRSLKKLSSNVLGFAAKNEHDNHEVYFYNAKSQQVYGKGIMLKGATDVVMDMCGNELAVFSRVEWKNLLVLYSDKDNFTGTYDDAAVPVATMNFVGLMPIGAVRIGNVLAVNRYGDVGVMSKDCHIRQELFSGGAVNRINSLHGGLATFSYPKYSMADPVVKISFWKQQSPQKLQQKNKRKKCKKYAAVATGIAAPLVGILVTMYSYL